MKQNIEKSVIAVILLCIVLMVPIVVKGASESGQYNETESIPVMSWDAASMSDSVSIGESIPELPISDAEESISESETESMIESDISSEAESMIESDVSSEEEWEDIQEDIIEDKPIPEEILIPGETPDIDITPIPEPAVTPTLIPEPDITYPVIEISGVRDRSANKDPLQIVITLTDEHLNEDGLSVTLRGTRQGLITIPTPVLQDGVLRLNLPKIEEDDYYILEVMGTDLSGNTVSQKISFSENQNGAVVEAVDQTLNGSKQRQGVQPAYIISDLDETTILAVTVNGRDVSYRYENGTVVLEEELQEEGRYEVKMKIKDASGHETEAEPVLFEIDRTAPILSIEGEQPGKYSYREPFSACVRRDLAEDHYREIRINDVAVVREDTVTEIGKIWVNAEDGIVGQTVEINVKEAGSYRISVIAYDDAGNESRLVSEEFVLKRKNALFTGKSQYVGAFAATVATILCFPVGISVFFRKKSGKDK